MRSIGDPDYVYQPWPEERRKAASKAAKERIAGKPGHALVYGITMPERLARVLRPLAYEIARRDGRDAAVIFVETAMSRWNNK